MPWLGVTLHIDPDAADGFGESLLEAGAQSVALEDLEAPRTRLSALLPRDADAAGMVAAAAAATGLASAPQFLVEEIPDEDWVRKTQAQFAPLELGARLWIGPTWHRPAPGRVAVQLDPGLAFGTGTHPTTRLVLRLLDSTIRGGESVLDYGCGSGILAIAAAKLGAARVDAVDTDPQAVQTAAANARANNVDLRVMLPEALAAATYDIVVSNILAQPLVLLAPLLAALSAPRGLMALSGILQSQASEVIAAYAPWCEMHIEETEQGWVLLSGRRK